MVGWLLVVGLVIAALAGLGLGLRSADADRRLARLEAALGEDRLALEHAFKRGIDALRTAADAHAAGTEAASLLDQLIEPGARGLTAVAFHDGSGHPVSGRPRLPLGYLETIDPVALPTLRPAVSLPYRPASGDLAVSAIVPVHPEPGPVRAYFSGEINLTDGLRRLQLKARDRGLVLTLLDAHQRHILGSELPDGPLKQGLIRALRTGSLPPGGAEIPGDGGRAGLLALPQAGLGWTAIIWSR
jgi:hypothetical protein